MMKVSIIIPVYNEEKYLEESLKSAINQTYPNIEIIAINDGSTDKSLEILRKYSSKIKIFSKKNGGLASALNAGIKAAEGEWIKYLSADDIMYPQAIEELISEAKKLKDKKNIILYSNYERIDSEGKIIDAILEPDYGKFDAFDFKVMLLDHICGSDGTVLMHKSILDKYGLFDETVIAEDWEFRLRHCILHNCSLHHVPIILYKRRIHQGQLTKKFIKISLKGQDKIRRSILDKLDLVERQRFEKALKEYRKRKPIIEKCKYFVRYDLSRILPASVSIKLIDIYWYLRKKKILHNVFF